MSIKDYEFSSGMAKIVEHCVGGLIIDIPGGVCLLSKQDIIAMAKHFKLNAHDIECSEHKALCADLNQVDEDHFDEIVEIQANKIKINKSIN